MPDLPPPSSALRFAVIGGGVSGLAAAHRLTQLVQAATVRLFEAGPRLGGALDTVTSDGLVLEQGADSFLTRDPVAVDLCRELGLTGELLPTNETHRRALVVCRGQLVPVPAGFVLMQPRQLGAVLRSPVLSLRGKLRLLREPWIRRHAGARAVGYDESVADFATRRLGRETFERLVEPLLGGIYVADATQLSLAATMPEFLAAERDHGSLRRAWQSQQGGATDQAAGARYGAFVTLRGGVGRLIESLAAHLPNDCVQLSRSVAQVSKSDDGLWRVTSADGASEQFHGIVATTPAARTAAMVQLLDPQLAGHLARIQAASSVVVTLLYAPGQITRPLDGFGFVVPRIENRQILAASFPSVKFPGRGSAELTPVRVFLGGALRPDMIDRDDVELIAIARRELEDLIGARGDLREAMVARWRDAMPQYHVGHLTLVDSIDERVRAHHGLELAGNSYRGVGIPQCVRSGREAAERLARELKSRSDA